MTRLIALALMLAGCESAPNDAVDPKENVARQWAARMGYVVYGVSCFGLRCSLRVANAPQPIALRCFDGIASGCEQVVSP